MCFLHPYPPLAQLAPPGGLHRFAQFTALEACTPLEPIHRIYLHIYSGSSHVWRRTVGSSAELNPRGTSAPDEGHHRLSIVVSCKKLRRCIGYDTPSWIRPSWKTFGAQTLPVQSFKKFWRFISTFTLGKPATAFQQFYLLNFVA